MDLNEILSTLNALAPKFRFGNLQDIRRKRRQLKRRPSRHPFRPTTEYWAHHIGGRDELQFNVAWEDDGDLRWGVAVSLQPSRSLPDVTTMHLKLRTLGRVLETHGSYLHNRGFTMWDWTEHAGGRSRDRPPGPIADDLYASGSFVMVGKHVPPESFDACLVLRDFDTLLPIYEFVECDSDSKPPALYKPDDFVFKPDLRPRDPISNPRTLATRTPGETLVSYKHRKLQDVLKNELINEGVEVGTEHRDGNGGYIDLVAHRDGVLEFYEIKSDSDPRLCIRHALGQLLEYAYWADAARKLRLFVVGDCPIDTETEAYLQGLRDQIGLPICYRHIECEADPDE